MEKLHRVFAPRAGTEQNQVHSQSADFHISLTVPQRWLNMRDRCEDCTAWRGQRTSAEWFAMNLLRVTLLAIVLVGRVFAQSPISNPDSSNDPTHIQQPILSPQPDVVDPPATKVDTQPPALDNGKFGKRYNNLSEDDRFYTPRLPIWRPIASIILQELVLNTFDTYVLQYDYTRIGEDSWLRNLKAGVPWGDGWKWDQDRFGVNFFFHPYTGVGYFNAARAGGYSFWEATPFVFAGSYAWKIFGENGKPEREDLINTTCGGMFGGEILYRLGSNVLDDRTSGSERIMREVVAGILSPTRLLNRVISGAPWRVTPEEIYQKEPLNIAMYAGGHLINDGSSFATGPFSEVFDLQLDYGDPFEKISRKPYDVFKVRLDINFGVGRKIIDNTMGYGLLFGKNVEIGNLLLLVGGFQEYDYWDNFTFEVGTLGFGPGIISRVSLFEKADLYTTIHFSLVPFGGNNFRYAPDTSQVRDYSFVGGYQGKFETTFSLGRVGSISFMAYYYWLHSYDIQDYPANEPGTSMVQILRPRITVGLTNNLSIGFEQLFYYNNRTSDVLGDFHRSRTEQRLFLQLFFENRKLDDIVTQIVK